MVNPILKEVNPIIQILGPRGKWLHGEEALLIPKLGHLIIE
jgi:hypothetical protein